MITHMIQQAYAWTVAKPYPLHALMPTTSKLLRNAIKGCSAIPNQRSVAHPQPSTPEWHAMDLSMST